MTTYSLEQSWFPHFFYSRRDSAPFWLAIRLYVGYEWLLAGIEKLMSPAWIGGNAGAAMNGFVQGALHKTAAFCTNASACHPDVQDWYASFLNSAVLPHAVAWSYAITVGELLVGLGLIFGCLTGLAALFGVFMNLNFMLAGTVSVNPILATLGIFLVLAWRVAGYWGLDRFVLPRLFPRLHHHPPHR